MIALLSNVFVGGMSISQIAIAIVVFAAVCALVFVALRQFGVSPPDWFLQCLWIVIIAVVVVVAIRFVMSI